MRVEVLRSDRLRLVRTVAVVALTALGAGCSSGIARFDDGFYTGALPTKPTPQASVAANASQPYPGSLDATRTASIGGPRDPMYDGAAASRIPSYPTAGVREGAVQRATLAPPSQSSNVATSAPTYTPPAPASEPVEMAAAPARSEPAPLKAGWNKTGNSVTLREGETLETLANRYGVPVKAIVAANGLVSAADAVPGQSIAIPTYSYGSKPGAAQIATNSAASGEGRVLGAPPQTLRAPTQRMAAATPGRVTVEAGDTLTAVARRAGVTVAELKAANGMTEDTVRLGQKLILPGGAAEPRQLASINPKEGMETRPATKPAAKAVAETAAKQPQPYKAPATEAVAKTAEAKPAALKPAPAEAKPAAPVVAAKPAAPAKAETPTEPQVASAPAASASPATSVEKEAEKESAEAPASTGIDQFRWPVQGRVIKRFGEKDGTRRSDGLDISVPSGTPVKAAENGVVIYAGDGLKEFGNTVLVRHDNGLVTVYGHADGLKVKRGETVKRGQEIATAGMSGDANAPMLHFEVRKNSAPVDPSKYLQ